MPVDRTSRASIESTADAFAFAEDSSNRVQEVLVKAKKSLVKLYATIFPKLPQTKTLVELADTFFLDNSDPLEVLKRPSRRSGALLAFQLLMGHGVTADFDAMSKALPEADGVAVDLNQHARLAKKYTRQLIDLVEKSQKDGVPKSTPDASGQTGAP